MAEMKENSVKPEVKMLNSIAIAILDKDDKPTHVQIVIGQYVESGRFVCYFDVVDPSKVKLADDTVSASATD